CVSVAGRVVEQETFWRGVLEFFEKRRVQKRQLDRVLDRLERVLLAAYFFPGQLRDNIEIMIARLRSGEQLEGDAVIAINSHFVAGFERRFRELRGTLQNNRVQPVLRADAQAIISQNFRDLAHRARRLETEFPD